MKWFLVVLWVPLVMMTVVQAGSRKVTDAPGVLIMGTVNDPDGKPVEGAVAIWGDSPYWQPGNQEVLTNNQLCTVAATLAEGGK